MDRPGLISTTNKEYSGNSCMDYDEGVSLNDLFISCTLATHYLSKAGIPVDVVLIIISYVYDNSLRQHNDIYNLSHDNCRMCGRFLADNEVFECDYCVKYRRCQGCVFQHHTKADLFPCPMCKQKKWCHDCFQEVGKELCCRMKDGSTGYCPSHGFVHDCDCDCPEVNGYCYEFIKICDDCFTKNCQDFHIVYQNEAISKYFCDECEQWNKEQRKNKCSID